MQRSKNIVQALIKDKKGKFLQDKLSENIGARTKGALENYLKNGFTRKKDSHDEHMPQYEKRVDIFSQDNRKQSFCESCR